jgi:hypothetical protein
MVYCDSGCGWWKVMMTVCTYTMLLNGIANPVVRAVIILQTGVLAIGCSWLGGHVGLSLVGLLDCCVGVDV